MIQHCFNLKRERKMKMSKLYFEMNDKEKQLHHIAGNLDYAISIFGEGLSGTGDFNLGVKEVNKLQRRIGDHLMKAHEDISLLLKAVEEKEERESLVFNPIGGADELKKLVGCKVYLTEDVENKEKNFYATEIAFFNEKTGKYINILKDNDGQLSVSQWY